MDVSERVELQRQSQHLTEQLEKAQELAHVGSWEVDLATRSVRWSDEARRISDVGSDAVDVGRLAERITPRTDSGCRRRTPSRPRRGPTQSSKSGTRTRTES